MIELRGKDRAFLSLGFLYPEEGGEEGTSVGKSGEEVPSATNCCTFTFQ